MPTANGKLGVGICGVGWCGAQHIQAFAQVVASGGGVPALARAHMGLYVYRRDTLLKLAALPAVRLALSGALVGAT